MINNIQEFAAHFGATTPTELQRALWKLDSYVSSAAFQSTNGEKHCTYPDFVGLDQFPQGIVSVEFYATKEGCDYEPAMTPLVFPFENSEIDQAIEYLDGELNMVDEWGEDFVGRYTADHSVPLTDKWKVE